jgi:hypothetical protein
MSQPGPSPAPAGRCCPTNEQLRGVTRARSRTATAAPPWAAASAARSGPSPAGVVIDGCSQACNASCHTARSHLASCVCAAAAATTNFSSRFPAKCADCARAAIADDGSANTGATWLGRIAGVVPTTTLRANWPDCPCSHVPTPALPRASWRWRRRPRRARGAAAGDIWALPRNAHARTFRAAPQALGLVSDFNWGGCGAKVDDV